MTQEELIDSGLEFALKNTNINILSKFDSVDIPLGCAFLEVKKNQVKLLDYKHVDQLRLKQFLKFLVSSVDSENLDFRFILNTRDESCDSDFPIVQFFKQKNSNCICVPDPHTTSLYLDIQHTDKKTFDEKIDNVVFRGSDTGSYPNVLKNERISITKLFHDKFNIGISNFVNYSRESLEYFGLNIDIIKKGFMSKEDQIDYKYIADINGNTVSWDRNMWAMSTNSILFKIFHHNDPKIFLWYSKYMVDNGIVPVLHSSEVEEFVRQDNTELLNKQIKFSKILNLKSTHADFLNQLFSRYNFEYNKYN